MRTDQTDRWAVGSQDRVTYNHRSPIIRIEPARSVFREMIEIAWVGMLGTIADKLEDWRARAVGRGSGPVGLSVQPALGLPGPVHLERELGGP